jgi:quinol monooxygenase YgiN
MPDLHVVALLQAKSGSEGVVSAALVKLAEASRAEEGCIAYAVNLSAADPTTFVTVEQWRSEADLEAHMQTPHIGEALSVTGDHLAAPPAIHPLAPVG